MRRLERALRALRRVTRQNLMLLLTALAFGFGGGLGGLAMGTQKVGKPERENPVVCIAERASDRS